MRTIFKMASVLLLSMAFYGCGGGGGGGNAGGPLSDSDVFPAGKATLTFTVSSTEELAVPISGIDFTITLPTGMTVATEAGSTTGKIKTEDVSASPTLSGTNLAYGTYLSTSGNTDLVMATTSDKFKIGEFLRLTCTVAPNSNITLKSLKDSNTPLKTLKVVGIDTAKNTVIMSNKVSIAIGAIR